MKNGLVCIVKLSHLLTSFPSRPTARILNKLTTLSNSIRQTRRRRRDHGRDPRDHGHLHRRIDGHLRRICRPLPIKPNRALKRRSACRLLISMRWPDGSTTKRRRCGTFLPCAAINICMDYNCKKRLRILPVA